MQLLFGLDRARFHVNAVRSAPAFALCGLVAITWAVSPGRASAQENDPPPVVVLLHPSIKEWSKDMEGFRVGITVQTAKGVIPHKVQIGAALKDVKDARFIYQIGPPYATFSKPSINNKGKPVPTWHTPYVLLFRESPKAKPVEFLKDTWHETPAKEPTGERIAKIFYLDLSHMLALKVADKPRVKEPLKVGFGYFPVDIVQEKEQKVAAILLNNRWPFGVGIRITTLYAALPTMPGDRFLGLDGVRDERGDIHDRSIVVNLAAGEKRKLIIPYADLRGVNVRWAMANVVIVDSAPAPVK